MGPRPQNQERYVASKMQADRRASKRARIIKGSVLAASAVAAVAAVPTAAAPPDSTHNTAPHQAFRNNDRLPPDSVVSSGTVFPLHGVNLAVGQNLPYATNWTG